MCSQGDPDFSFCGIVLLTSVSKPEPCSGFLLPFYDWTELAGSRVWSHLQEFGICLKGDEQDRTDGQVWGRKEMLSIGEGTCVGFGFL